LFSLCLASGALAEERRSCLPDDCDFPETKGALVFRVGVPERLSGALTYSLTVRDGEGECRKIEALLLKALSKAFPAWRYVAEGPADLEIVYQSGFSLCLDECEDRALPQGAQVQMILGRGEVQANWSDDSHWRARGRLVSLFVSALQKAVRGQAA
jgi:hypothetical protein